MKEAPSNSESSPNDPPQTLSNSKRDLSDLDDTEGVMAPGSEEQKFEERISRLVTEMDELCELSRNDPSLVEQQAIGIGQIQFRAELILSFLEARKVSKLKLVSNHG